MCFVYLDCCDGADEYEARTQCTNDCLSVYFFNTDVLFCSLFRLIDF